VEIADIKVGQVYSQSEISHLFEQEFNFNIPNHFMPDESLASLGMFMFGNGLIVEVLEKQEDMHTGYSNPGGMWQPEGSYAIGQWGHGVNSYRFCYRVCEQNRYIWLELAWGGMYMDNEKEGHDIEMYLSELDLFLEKADQMGIYVKVIDSMWNGDYRLSAADGNGVHYEESLIGSMDLNGKFNRMLADFAVFTVGRKSGMRQFIDDDPAYVRWLAGNPSGWVLNAHRQAKADYLVIHRSRCWTISRSGVRYTSGDFLKMCGSDPENLSDWAVSQTGATPDMCKKCSS